MKNFKEIAGKNLLLILIILLATFLRLYKLGQIPEGINRDEAAIGYNAFTILKTGRDEWGKILPFYFKSFGDWKMPVYIYLTVPSVAIFGLDEFSVRLPSAIFGILTVLAVYFLTKEIFKSPITTPGLKKFNLGVAELAAFLLAISPWHIDYSRQAYEPTVAIFWLVLGSYLLLKNNKKLLTLVLLLFLLAIFTYHTTILLALILFFYLLATKPKFIAKANKKAFLAILMLMIVLISQFSEKRAVKDKFYQQTVFNDQSLMLEKIILIRDVHSKNDLVARFFHNRFWEGLLTAGENYFKSISADFLFFGNDPYPRFYINKKSLRLNYFILLPFLLIGIFNLLKKRDNQSLTLLIWLLVAPILSSFVTRSPSSYRLLPLVIPITIISSYGLMTILEMIKKSFVKKAFILVLSVFLALDFIKISEEYVYHRDGGLEFQYQKLIKFYKLIANKRQKDLLLIASRLEESPYIFVAFYQKLDPHWFLANIKRYPADKYGFEHVVQLGEKYQFKPIVWEEKLKDNTAYIDLYNQVPPKIRELGKDTLTIKNKIGEALFFELIN